MVFHLKNQCNLILTLRTPPKVKSMVSSYVPLQIQLLFVTFFCIYHSFREILMHYLKWDTLCMCVCCN